MRIIKSIKDLPIPSGPRIFVPTMGAFHEGHLNLMRAAKRMGGEVYVSIFVNPTQFGPREDYTKYPRPFDRDCAMAESVGVDVVFAPNSGEIYPRRTTSIHVPGLIDRWEGAHRPGHFDGVATVVLKLFNMVRPTHAVFGWKDLQQCVVIRRMVEDLNVPIELSFEETTREADGLAMSSRNAYLDPGQRVIAPELFRSISAIGAAGAEQSIVPSAILKRESDRLTQLGFAVDYLACVDTNDLSPTDRWRPSSAVIVAAKIGSTRLIDNIRF